jgi:hypothetical protein
MDEIAAIKTQIAAGTPVTRAAVLAHIASTTYNGATGTLAFDAHGDPRTPPAFQLYVCDASGDWKALATPQS